MKAKRTEEAGFKQTEIGIIPRDWDIAELTENGVAKLIMGQSPPSSTYNDAGKGMPFLQGKAEFGTVYPTPTKWCTHPSRIAEKGDILISVRAPVGDVNIAPYECAIGRGLAAIRVQELIVGIFLFQYLGFSKQRIESYGTGSIFKSINKKVLETFFIIIPAFSEQQKIASVLSKIQQAIEQQDKIIQITKELKKSLLNKLFTEGLHDEEQKETEIGMMPKSWRVENIINIVEKTKMTDPTKNPNVSFKYIDVSGISNESFRIVDYKTYKGSGAPSRARKLINKDDVIFATVRPTLKRIAYIEEYFNGEICSTAFCVLRSEKDILSSRYIYYCVQMDGFIEELSKLQRGASYPAITDGDVKRQKIPLPSIEEQKEIANILSSVDRKIQQAESRKQTLQSLFKSMLNQLMTGRVRVKDIADIDFKEVMS